MDWSTITLFVFGLILLLLFMGTPVAAGLGLVAMLTAVLFLGKMGGIAFAPWTLSSSFIMTAIPLFIFMGDLFLYGGLSKKLYDGSTAIVGKLPGGLLHANIVSCAVFAAISGSSVATSVTIGTMAIPELEKRGYDIKLVLGSLAAGGTLGILIPPSIALIIYGVLVGESVGALFMGGIIPGILLSLLFMLYIGFRVLRRPALAPSYVTMPWKSRIVKALEVWPTVILIGIIFGGIYTGVMTPTEAAAVGASVALLYSLAYRKITWRLFTKSLLSAVKTSTMVLFIVIAANMVSGTLSFLKVPAEMSAWATSLGLAPLMLLSFIFLMYIFLGCFFDGISMMVLTLPVIYPIVIALGFDSIWFGIVLVILIEMAAITPPVGLNLYAIHGLRPDRPISEVIIGALSFFIVMIAMLGVLKAFPILATWLPSTMGGG